MNLKSYIGKDYTRALVSYATNTFQIVTKWWPPRHTSKVVQPHILKRYIIPQCNLCPLQENDTCLHLPSYCTSQNINNLCTNKHNEAVHTPASTLMVYPTTRCFTLIKAGKIKDQTFEIQCPHGSSNAQAPSQNANLYPNLGGHIMHPRHHTHTLPKLESAISWIHILQW